MLTFEDIMKEDSTLKEFVGDLQSLYGDALQSVVLYGSYARGDFRAGSDVDLLVLLNLTNEEIRQKEDALCELIYQFEVKKDVEISPVTLSMADYKKWKHVHEFLKNVQQDGVTLYGTAA